MKTNQENEVESGSEVETQQDKIWGDYVVVLKEKIDRQFEPQRTSGESSLRNVRVRFEVNRQGQLLQVELTQSSGSLAVDQAAVLAVRRAAPFSAFPRRAAEDQLRINFTFDGLD
jgi:TonB family protein